MKIRNSGLLLLFPLCVLTGCRQELSPAAATAMEEQALATRLASDHATILFARQEEALARSGSATPAAASYRGPLDPEQQAQLHMEAAAMQLKLDEDRAQTQTDLHAWKKFALQTKAYLPQ